MKSSWSCCNLLKNGKAVFEQKVYRALRALAALAHCVP